jgi:hypothetical protein
MSSITILGFTSLLPFSPPSAKRRGGVGGGGLSASPTAYEYAEAAPTADPSSPRATRAEGGEEVSAPKYGVVLSGEF